MLNNYIQQEKEELKYIQITRSDHATLNGNLNNNPKACPNNKFIDNMETGHTSDNKPIQCNGYAKDIYQADDNSSLRNEGPVGLVQAQPEVSRL